MLAIIYNNVVACDSVLKTDYVLRLHTLQLTGETEHALRLFYNEAKDSWPDLLNKVEHNVGEEGKRDSLYYKMKLATTILKDRLIRDYESLPCIKEVQPFCYGLRKTGLKR